jgi:hypothetical protein
MPLQVSSGGLLCMTKSQRLIFSKEHSSSIGSLIRNLFKEIRHGDAECSGKFS